MRFNIWKAGLVLIAIAAVASSASAQTQDDKTLSPYFFVQGDPSVDHLPLKDTRVEIAVSGLAERSIAGSSFHTHHPRRAQQAVSRSAPWRSR